MILEKVYDELMAQIEDLKKAVASMSGGTDDYDDLSNRPKVNNITLSGNKKSSDLKIVYNMTEAEYASATKNAESIYCLQENATEFEEEDSFAASSIASDWTTDISGGYLTNLTYAPSNQDFTNVIGVTCDNDLIEVLSYEVDAHGDVMTALHTDDYTAITGTLTFTYTLTQPAGATRIVKNGVAFADNYAEVKSISAGSGTTTRQFTFDKKPKMINVNWSVGDGWHFTGSFVWGSERMFYLAHNTSPSTTGDAGGVTSLTYSSDKKSVTLTGGNAAGAINTEVLNGVMFVQY